MAQEKIVIFHHDERGAVRTWSEVGELVRCRDCKWYGRADKRRFYRGMDCLQKRIDTIVPDKDFCSRAERRIDD